MKVIESKMWIGDSSSFNFASHSLWTFSSCLNLTLLHCVLKIPLSLRVAERIKIKTCYFKHNT